MNQTTFTLITGFGLTLAAFMIRKFSPASSKLHTPLGLFLVALVAGGSDAAGHAIFQGGLHASIVVPAVIQFGMSLIATASPVPTAAALLPLFFLVTLAGCPAAITLRNCEIGKLPQAEQAGIALVSSIVDDTSKTLADLEAAALQLAPGQVDCIILALSTYWNQSAPKGEIAPLMAHRRALLAAYLAKHPATACGPQQLRQVKRMVVLHMLGDGMRAAMLAWAEENYAVGICDRKPAESDTSRMCRPMIMDPLEVSYEPLPGGR